MTIGHVIYLITAFLLVIGGSSVLHYIERKDLYRYIKSDDIREYDSKEKEPPKSLKSAHRDALNKWKRTGGED